MKKNLLQIIHLAIVCLLLMDYYSSNAQTAIFNSSMSISTFGSVNSPPGEEYGKIIDGNTNTKFLDFTASDGMGFTVNLGGASAIASSISITTANDFSGRDPRNYEVLGSNDGSNYTSIATGLIQCISTRFHNRNYYFANTTAYKYYRVNFTNTCSEDMMQLSEVQLYTCGPAIGGTVSSNQSISGEISSTPDGEANLNSGFFAQVSPEIIDYQCEGGYYDNCYWDYQLEQEVCENVYDPCWNMMPYFTPGHTASQSFMTSSNVTLSAIKIDVANVINGGSYFLRIFEGEGDSGTELMNQGISINNSGTNTFDLNTPLALTGNQSYTFKIESKDGYATFDWTSSNDSDYLSGSGFTDGNNNNRDFNFQLVYQSNVNWQSVTLTGFTGGVQKWQKDTDINFSSPIDIESTSATLDPHLVGDLFQTTYFRAVVVGCSTVYSDYVTVSVVLTTAAPTADAQTFCGSKTVADLVATGTHLKWYDVATGGTALSTSTALATGTYYVSQTVSGTESERTSVAVTVHTTAAPTAAAQAFCGSKTVADLVATGTDLKWYADATGGAPLTSDIALVTSTNYYVSQTENGCESTRTGVAVTINNSVAGTISNDQLIFTGTPPANITLTGNEGAVQWQSSLNNSTFADIAEATGTTLTGTQMGALTTKRYYRAVVTSGSCASVTSGVVTVSVIPSTKIQATQCGQTLATLSTAIVANSVPSATNYRFKVVNGATTETIETVSRWFRLSSLAAGVLYNTTYTINVATRHNGVWGPYGDECNVTTPAVPATKIQASQCGITLPTLGTAIVTNAVSLVSNYRFKVVNGTTTQTIDSSRRWFYLTSLSSGVLYATTYTISVATQYNGVWGAYGEECNVTTPAVPLTKVQTSQCDQTLADLSTAIVANTVSGATNYRFKVVNGAKTRYAEMANRWFRLTALTGGAAYNTTYKIRVATKYNGVWGDYGDECSVTTPSAPLTRPADVTTATELVAFKVTGYPNPYTNTFKLDITTQSNASIAVRVYDMVGKLIEVRNSGVAELSTMEIGDHYATGVYNVIVTQGTEVKSLRMIKK